MSVARMTSTVVMAIQGPGWLTVGFGRSDSGKLPGGSGARRAREGSIEGRGQRLGLRRRAGWRGRKLHRLGILGGVEDRQQLGLVEDHLFAGEAGQVVKAGQLDGHDGAGLL